MANRLTYNVCSRKIALHLFFRYIIIRSPGKGALRYITKEMIITVVSGYIALRHQRSWTVAQTAEVFAQIRTLVADL